MREAVKIAGAIAMAALVSCASGSTTTPTTSSGGGGQGGRGGSANTAGSDAGRGGSSTGGKGGSGPVGDAIPLGAVSFFNGSACPTGWAAHDTVAGRVAVPTVGPALGGAAVGAPLASGEDRKHAHSFHASFTLPAFSYAGIAGEANHGVAAAGTITLDAKVDDVSLGLPYVQLLVCKKAVDPVPGVAPLPSGMLMFFETTGCPDGWQQPEPTQGRMMVGLPNGAPPDMTFGGAPIDTTDPRKHTHGTDPILVTEPHGIALAKGCCASGYGVDDTYQSVQSTSETDPGMPFVTLLQCQKQ